MSNNFEKFIIELGFEDKEALKGIKTFLGKMDEVNKQVVSSVRKGKQAKQVSNQEDNKTLDLLQAQISLRRKITQATKLGVDTSNDERSLARAKQASTLKKRQLELEKKITQEQLRAAKAKPFEDAKKREKAQQEQLAKKSQQEQAALEKKLAQEKAAREKQEQRVKAQIEKQKKQEKAALEKKSKQEQALLVKKAKQEQKELQRRIQAEKKAEQRLAAQKLRQIQAEDRLRERNRKKREADQAKEEQRKQRAIQKAYLAEQRAIEKLSQERLSEAEKAKRRQHRIDTRSIAVESSEGFRQLDRTHPEKAEMFRNQMEGFRKRAGKLGMTPDEVRSLDLAFKRYNKTLERTTRSVIKHQRETQKLSVVQNGLRDSTRNLIRSYASMFALLAGASAINTIGQDFETMSASMLIASKTSKRAAQDLKFVRDEALRLGLDLRTATDGFVKLKVAADGKISNEDTEKLFTGFNEFATAVGAGKFRTDKGMMALQQMLNKGQIMAEELKNQLDIAA